jgi:hypothetical protein
MNAMTNLISKIAFGLTGAVLALTAVAQVEGQDNASLKAELIAASPIYEYIADNFGDEIDQMIVNIEGHVASGLDPSSAGAAAMLTFRTGHAADIAAASDKAQRSLINAMIEIHETVLAEEGPKVCALFASYGFPAFVGTPLEEKYWDLQMQQNMATLAAANSGSDNPVQRDVASDADNSEVADALLALGADDAQLDALINVTTKSLALCDAKLNLMRAMNTDGDTAGSRVRADYLAEIAAV